MANFDPTQQHKYKVVGLSRTSGEGVTINDVSGQTFTVPCKMKKILGGIGVMDTDGIPVRATPNSDNTEGKVTFTRLAPISTSADTITYELWGY